MRPTRLLHFQFLIATLIASADPARPLADGNVRFAAVRTELLAIVQADQQPRMQLTEAEQAGTLSPAERATLLRQMQEADTLNLPKIEAILAAHGWLGPDDVGKEASSAFFLVIQHSNLATQKKYLPVMREAVKAGKARDSSLALLEDRIALREGRPQIYGSQLLREGAGSYYVQATEDPDRLDERRAAIGLPPMADYLKHWNLVWNLEAYKEQLPALLEKLAARRKATTGQK